MPENDNHKKIIGTRTFSEHPKYILVFYKNPDPDFKIYPLLVEIHTKGEDPPEKGIKVESSDKNYELIMDSEAEKFKKGFLDPLDHLEKALLTPLSDSDYPDPYEGLDEIKKIVPKN